MSSNGFLTELRLESLPVLRFSGGRIKLCRACLIMSSGRSWYVESSDGRAAVLLLRHKSFWWSGFAGITLQTGDSKRRVLWFFRRRGDGRCAAAWRRMRVHFGFRELPEFLSLAENFRVSGGSIYSSLMSESEDGGVV